jgi:4a-hydroxytetrahydrobiopterin dehydratase
MSLADSHCIPCRGGVTPLSAEQVHTHLAGLSGWALAADGKSIEKQWKFKDFSQAMAFVNRVGVIAEAEDHHPDIAFGWGYVRLTLCTHSIGGLHLNDFIVAAQVDRL